MLQDSNVALARIAGLCGFGTADGMRRTFRRNLGVSPHDYRSRFRSAWIDDGAPSRPSQEPTGALQL